MAILQNYAPSYKCVFTIITLLDAQLNYLEAWLQSLLQQEHYYPTEIILISDGCADQRDKVEGILQLYKKEIQEHPYQFFYLDYATKFGKYQSLNHGIQSAHGEWIYLLSGDDKIAKNAFLEFAAVIKEFPHVDVMSGRFLEIDEQEKICQKSPDLAPEGFTGQEFRDVFLTINPLHLGCTLYRKQVLCQAGGLNIYLQEGTTWELYRRLSRMPLNWYYIPRYLYHYRLYPQRDVHNSLAPLNGESLWQVLELGETYYTAPQIIQAKRYQYQRLFQQVNSLFNMGKFAQGAALLLDIVRFSALGDRLWLTTLHNLSLEHRQTIIKTVETLTQKPYLT